MSKAFIFIVFIMAAQSSAPLVKAQGAVSFAPAAAAEQEDAAFTLRATVAEIVSGSEYALNLAGHRSVVELEYAAAPRREQKFGREAADYAQERLLGKKVNLHISRIKHDHALARVELDSGENLGLAMIRAGLAWATPECRDRCYLAAQEMAKAERIGLWSCHNPSPPRAGSNQTAQPQAQDPGATPIGSYVALAVFGFLAWYFYKVSRQVSRRLAMSTSPAPRGRPSRPAKPLTRLAKAYLRQKFGKDKPKTQEDL